MLPVAGKRSRSQQARSDRWLKEFAVPVAMRGANKRSRFCSCDDLRDGFFDLLKRLPVAPRRECVTVLPVGLVLLRIPVSRLHLFDQLGRDAVSFDGERVIRIAL